MSNAPIRLTWHHELRTVLARDGAHDIDVAIVRRSHAEMLDNANHEERVIEMNATTLCEIKARCIGLARDMLARFESSVCDSVGGP